MNFDEAFRMFGQWYEECLESGIEPEQVVEAMGEMKLLVNLEQIAAYEKGTEILDQ